MAPRRELLAAARAFARRLEMPIEAMWEMAHNHPVMYACLKVSLDNDIFNKLREASDKPKTTTDLAQPCVGPDLLQRLLRHLSAMKIIQEVEPDLWVPTRSTQALHQREILAVIDYARLITAPALMGLPEFLASTGYNNPGGGIDNWQFVTKSDQSHFEWLLKRSAIQKTFNDLMSGYAAQCGSWLDVYPNKHLLKTAESSTPLMVDVGGDVGHDVKDFLRKHPDASGSVVLQDLPVVIGEAKTLGCTGFEPMSHDIFTAQPIEGARTYYLHSVLHDWPEDKSREILRNLRPALKEGYNQLLVNELLVGTTGAERHQTSVDVTMASLFSSKERVEQDWVALLASTGLKVTKFWRNYASVESVIEVEQA